MSIRVISGIHKGRRIPSPVSGTTRPSTDMWRTTLFDVLSHHVEFSSAKVWDLYAGTGSLGLECLSRGAEYCTFVDNNMQCCRQLRTTMQTFQVVGQTTVIHSTVEEFLREITFQINAESTDLPLHNQKDDKQLSLSPTLVFADPPYSLFAGNPLLSKLSTMLPAGSLVVFEHGLAEAILLNNEWERVWSKERGMTGIEILRRVG